MQTNIDIALTFMETPDGVLSIHQISRRLKMPYGTAYNRLHLLHKQGIVQMMTQGKAKLCALNGENPMTASLLALGAAQYTDRFYSEVPEAGSILKSIARTFQRDFRSVLSSVILLNPNVLKEICTQSQDQLSAELGSTLDFFYITNTNDFDDTAAGTIINSKLPPGLSVQISGMAIDHPTLLGMFTENENDAGLSAYSMLHDGLVLFGFENFYSLILEAFSRRLVR